MLLLDPYGTTVVTAALFAQTLYVNFALDYFWHIALTHSPTNSIVPVSKFFYNDVFYSLVDPNPHNPYGTDGVPAIIFKNYASLLAPISDQAFPSLPVKSIFPSCWKYAYVQPVPMKINL